MARDLDQSATKFQQCCRDGISNSCVMWKRFWGWPATRTTKRTGIRMSLNLMPLQELRTGKDSLPSGKDYELSIEGVKSSEHGTITIPGCKRNAFATCPRNRSSNRSHAEPDPDNIRSVKYVALRFAADKRVCSVCRGFMTQF